MHISPQSLQLKESCMCGLRPTPTSMSVHHRGLPAILCFLSSVNIFMILFLLFLLNKDPEEKKTIFFCWILLFICCFLELFSSCLVAYLPIVEKLSDIKIIPVKSLACNNSNLLLFLKLSFLMEIILTFVSRIIDSKRIINLLLAASCSLEFICLFLSIIVWITQLPLSLFLDDLMAKKSSHTKLTTGVKGKNSMEKNSNFLENDRFLIGPNHTSRIMTNSFKKIENISDSEDFIDKN